MSLADEPRPDVPGSDLRGPTVRSDVRPRSFAPAARGPITLVWVVRMLLFASFSVAFLQYQLHSAIGQYLHLGLLFLAALAVLTGRNRKDRVQGLVGGGALLLAAVLFSEAISYISGDQYSTLYGLVFTAVVLASRLVVQEIGIPNVMRAFSQAGILTVGAVLLTGGRSLQSSTTRFSGGIEVHPNLVAFVLGGFLPVIIWRALEYKVRWRRWAAGSLAALDVVFIYYSGSRGTLGAVLIAAFVFAARRALSGPWIKQIRLRHWHLLVALLAVPLLVIFLAQHGRFGNIVDAVSMQLALNSSQRGLKSGLSGRTGFWHLAFVLLGQHGRWFFGFGYRAGDRLVGTIDNGYVQLLFESGLIAGALIFSSMVRVFALLWRASRLNENTPWTRYYTMLNSLMIIYFFNNISTRYLFSFGSSFSLLVILLMTASRRQLVGVPSSAPRPRSPVPVRVQGGMAWSTSPQQ